MAKVGDTVRFLNSIGGGRIVRIEGNIAHVEDSDGFEVPALLRECVVVMEAAAGSEAKPQTKTSEKPKAETPELPKIETAGGNSINIVMAFEPTDIKSLSSSEFDAVLVNAQIISSVSHSPPAPTAMQAGHYAGQAQSNLTSY